MVSILLQPGFRRMTGISGSGTVGPSTANTIAKFTAANTVGDSQITDDGTDITIAGSGLSGNLFVGTSSTVFSSDFGTFLTPSVNTTQRITLKNPNAGTSAFIEWTSVNDSNNAACLGVTSSGLTPTGGFKAAQAYVNASNVVELMLRTAQEVPITIVPGGSEEARFLPGGGLAVGINALVSGELIRAAKAVPPNSELQAIRGDNINTGSNASVSYLLGNNTGNARLQFFGSGHTTKANRLDVNGPGDISIRPTASGNSILMQNQADTNTIMEISQFEVIITPDPVGIASPNALRVVGAIHNTLAASTEAEDVHFDLARIATFQTGALAIQRAFRIDAPTYAFQGASVITDAATAYISGAPVAGTNATITNAYALWVDAGEVKIDATMTALTAAYTRRDSATQAVSTTSTLGDDSAEFVECSAAVTITLPDRATVAGRFFKFKKTDSGTTTTISRAGSDTIDGLTTIALATIHDSEILYAGSSEWKRI